MSHEHVLGLFPDEQQLVGAIKAMEAMPYQIEKVYSPVPSEKIQAALKQGKSHVGYFTLAGGILGFLSGYGLSLFTAGRWSLVVSGKPVFAYVPFLIVAFECTILFAVIGNVLGFMFKAGLSPFKKIKRYDPKCSGHYFGILVSCEAGQREKLVTFVRGCQGEISED